MGNAAPQKPILLSEQGVWISEQVGEEGDPSQRIDALVNICFGPNSHFHRINVAITAIQIGQGPPFRISHQLGEQGGLREKAAWASHGRQVENETVR